ncbi:hypothetical protein LINPERHAP2_LOCUS6038 [Linum perenne]
MAHSSTTRSQRVMGLL